MFVYHELCDMGPEEIAEATETPYNTVRSRLHHARVEFTTAMRGLKLARPLGPQDGDDPDEGPDDDPGPDVRRPAGLDLTGDGVAVGFADWFLDVAHPE